MELLLDRRDVRVHGQSLHLSRREYAVLELLFLKQGVILNKGAFLTHLYCGMDEPEMKTIDVIICRLRKKLATAGVPTLIDTVWGCGYILRDPTLDRQDDTRVMNRTAGRAMVRAGLGCLTHGVCRLIAGMRWGAFGLLCLLALMAPARAQTHGRTEFAMRAGRPGRGACLRPAGRSAWRHRQGGKRALGSGTGPGGAVAVGDRCRRAAISFRQ